MYWGDVDGELVDYYWIGIGEMEMYRMMGLLNPRNFLQQVSKPAMPLRPALELLPRLERAAFFYHLLPKLTHSRTHLTSPGIAPYWSLLPLR